MGSTLNGKALVDATNVLSVSMGLAIDPAERSGAERLQLMARSARVVKSFHHVFAPHMTDGTLKGERLSLFVVSDDGKARDVVQDMRGEIGSDAIDAGPSENARWTETLGYFNIGLGYKRGIGPQIGFKLVR